MKCLIAGLPNAGKTTYIGALAYLLQNPIDNQVWTLSEVPDDMSYLNKLCDPWLSLKPVDRTTRGSAYNIELALKGTNGKELQLSMPDIAGEDFSAIIQKQSGVIDAWTEKPDSLLLFIKDLPIEVLAEDFDDNENKKSDKLPTFELAHMSSSIQNLLLLRELHNKYNWKKVAIGFSAWDLKEDSWRSPREYLKSLSPFLNNFINHFFPDAFVFGVSAQGVDYDKIGGLADDFIAKTEKGERAYVVIEGVGKSYDLTLPLNHLV